MKLAAIVLVFLAIIIGVPLLTSISDTTSIINNPITILNETLTINVTGFQNATSINTSMPFRLANTNLSSVTVYNASNGAALVTSTDYYVDYTADTINFTNTMYRTVTVTNVTLVNYSYLHPNYVRSASSRSLVALLPLLFMIIVFLLVIDKVMEGEFIGLFKKR